MPTTYDLELGLFLRDPQTQAYLLELRYVPPEQNLFVRVVGREVVTFDLVRLRTLTFEPVKYGDELAAQLFTGQDTRDAFMQVVGAVRNAGTDLRIRLYIHADATELHEIR